MGVILDTNFPKLKLLKKGKVRDIYDLGANLLIVATDRISAFDVILPDGIPGKGEVLTQISKYWFEQTKDIIDNHMITTDANKFPKECAEYRDVLDKRSMLVKKSEPLSVECVVRGYLAGSGWTEYKESRTICGITIEPGLKESSKLKEPIFTPATKEDVGKHDINIDFAGAVRAVGKETAEKIRDTSIAVFKKATIMAEKKGIIIADTKFEFGISGGSIILIDEILTPDSSRFWPMDGYKEGRGQRSFDKQFVRDYLLSLNWDKNPPAPRLPEDIIRKTSERYFEALKRLAG